MEDMLLKYGVLLVALVIIFILAFFAFNALKSTVFPEEYSQKISAPGKNVAIRINHLCGVCSEEKYKNKECFILEAEVTEGNVITEYLPTLEAGKYVFKIVNLNNECGVNILG